MAEPPVAKRRKTNPQKPMPIYIHAGEDVQPVQPHAIMYFRNNEQIHIHESKEHLYIQYNENPWKIYPTAPRTSTDIRNNGKKTILLLYGDMPANPKDIFTQFSDKPFLRNQIYIEGNLLFLPTRLKRYLEFGPTNGEGVVQMTPLEERQSIGRSFMCKADNYKDQPQRRGSWFFMKCGKMRFTPGDIRPIE